MQFRNEIKLTTDNFSFAKLMITFETRQIYTVTHMQVPSASTASLQNPVLSILIDDSRHSFSRSQAVTTLLRNWLKHGNQLCMWQIEVLP